MATKNEVFQAHLGVYLQGTKQAKGRLLDHVCFVTGLHRKAALRKFRRLQLADPARTDQRGRREYYTPDVILALKTVWEAASEPCGELLHPVIPEYVRLLQRDRLWPHGPAATDKLLAMSLGTVKQRLAKFRRSQGWLRGRSLTKPGAIHALIPIRTGPWHEAPVGTEQVDTVAHCGDSVAGDFVYTVNGADVATLWGARRAQWNKGQEVTRVSLDQLGRETPFPIVEWHPDSGSEFINWHLKGWCDGRGQTLTRSRPNHKNDNCFVEERNGHVVRRFVGYTRLDAREVVAALNGLYDALTPYLNHFSASRRIVSKERAGASWKITREQTARTPYQRVLDRLEVSDEIKQRLRAVHEQLNPLLLKQEIDRRLKVMFTVQRRYGKPNLSSTPR